MPADGDVDPRGSVSIPDQVGDGVQAARAEAGRVHGYRLDKKQVRCFEIFV